MSGTKRGWWIDDDGFLRDPSNVHAYNLGQSAGLMDALTADRDRLREALADLSAWFRPVNGALTAGELLMVGCPNDLQATIDKARAAIGSGLLCVLVLFSGCAAKRAPVLLPSACSCVLGNDWASVEEMRAADYSDPADCFEHGGLVE